MKTKRVNLSISDELHSKAVVHADKCHATDFSGLVTKLILDDMRVSRPISELGKVAAPVLSRGEKRAS